MADREVLLLGSIALSNAEEVFRTVSSVLGDHVRRIPDGETGNGAYWIQCQNPFFLNNPQLEMIERDPDNPDELRPAHIPLQWPLLTDDGRRLPRDKHVSEPA